ncbi:SRPBCC family protein [Streptosporangium sp. NBC_01756]|uniref:SRPBCC family protein n=1 Tax=Streptosporangium sp. NBC_01756 TaxID=2975950 RepID=UPI002DD867A9|nr:carbon monoxide dehydrogenase subunit G [Streptosporangium sp. NBC_01756]WSC87679.1 carbon monoxide dehydrogenase subunit G [Streptosporangium sp. NBC_01756]
MKLAGSAVLGIDRDRVWSALQNPAVLVRTIPGCERLEETGPDTYRMTVTAGVASIKGVYQGEVALSEPDAPQRFVLRARGQGAPGTVEATVEIRLSEIEGGTRVDYDADAVIGGMIGGVGQRMLSSVAKRTAGEFFSAVESHLSSGTAAAPAATSPVGTAPAVTAPAVTAPAGTAPAVTASAGTAPVVTASGAAAVREPDRRVFERPAGRPATGAPAWPILAAFGMGAGIALGSAVIGWLLGRTGRRS